MVCMGDRFGRLKVLSTDTEREREPKNKKYARRFVICQCDYGYNSTLTIDRIDNDGDYSPENCRWISMSEQASNKRTNVLIEWNGERKTISQWAKVLNVQMKTLHNRLVRLHWPVERAMTQPFRKHPQSQHRA